MSHSLQKSPTDHPQSQEPDVDVYLADLDALPDDAAKLSDLERRRAQNFRFEVDRRRYVAARTWLRQILGSALNLAPDAVPIEIDHFQKPFLTGFPLHFNLSHSGPHATVALCRTAPVGIDLERPLPPGEALELQRFVCSEAESAELRASHDPDALFLRIWTAKEALLKGLGTGFLTPPSTLTIRGGAEHSRAESTDPNLDLTAWKLVTHPGPDASLITVAAPRNAAVSFRHCESSGGCA